MKVLLFAALSIVALGSASCKKTWQCGCVAPNDATRIIEIKAATKAHAESLCEDEALNDEGCCIDCIGG
jgi:hypothetical protein